MRKTAIKDKIIDLKMKLNKAKIEKRNLLQAHKDEKYSFLYHFLKYNEKKHSAKKRIPILPKIDSFEHLYPEAF